MLALETLGFCLEFWLVMNRPRKFCRPKSNWARVTSYQFVTAHLRNRLDLLFLLWYLDSLAGLWFEWKKIGRQWDCVQFGGEYIQFARKWNSQKNWIRTKMEFAGKWNISNEIQANGKYLYLEGLAVPLDPADLKVYNCNISVTFSAVAHY